jgi:hypothetical protein
MVELTTSYFSHPSYCKIPNMLCMPCNLHKSPYSQINYEYKLHQITKIKTLSIILLWDHKLNVIGKSCWP